MYALSVKNLTKTYKNGFTALKGIDINVEQGDFFALLGPNGAGKTTFIGIVCSLINKSSGKVYVFGKDMDKELEVAKSYIGLVPQEFNFYMFEKVENIIINQAGLYGIPVKIARQRAEKYLKRLELWDKRHLQAHELSGGMKRRLMICRALIHEPKLLILDEPTAGVDIEVRRSMWQFLRDMNQQGVTIILTTHYLEEAENLCRSIAIIDQGKITENTKMNILLTQLHAETFVLYLKNPLEVCPELAKFTCRLIDPKTLEVDVQESQNMNELFAELSRHNTIVTRLRNKANRLEELFMRLVAEEGQAHVE